MLGSSDTSGSSEKETSPPPSADTALAQDDLIQNGLDDDGMRLQSGRKEPVLERISLSNNLLDIEKQKDSEGDAVQRKSTSDVDILDLISSDGDDNDEEKEMAAPIIHLTTVGMEENSRTIPEEDVQELIATDDEDYVAVMATAKKDEPKKTEQPPTVRMRYRPGPASSKKGMPSVVYDLSSDDEEADDEGNEADGEDDVVDVLSDNEDGNSYLDHRGSSSEDFDDSDDNSYLEHRGDSSDEPNNDGCEENCENSVVIEEEEAVCIVGEIRNESIEEEEEVENNNAGLLVQIDDGEREKARDNNVVVETIDDEEENEVPPSSSPAPFVISEVRTGIGTEAENDWDDILVEEIDHRQSSVEPESTPRSRFNHHLPRPSSNGGPEVVRLSPPREMVEPEITLLPIASIRPEPPSSRTEANPQSTLDSSTNPGPFRSTFAGIAPRPPTASSSKQLILEPPEQQVLSRRSRRRSLGQMDSKGLHHQVLSARESPRNEWDAVDTSEGGGRSNNRLRQEEDNTRLRQEWDSNLRLNTVADSSNATPAPRKRRKKQGGKKKQKAVARKQIVDDTNSAAQQEDQSIDIYLDNDDEVEALD